MSSYLCENLLFTPAQSKSDICWAMMSMVQHKLSQEHVTYIAFLVFLKDAHQRELAR